MPYSTTGMSWSREPGAAETRITWSFADLDLTALFQARCPGYASFDGSIGDIWRPLVRRAFEQWEVACGIDFVEVDDSINSDIRVGEDYIDGSARRGSSVVGEAQVFASGSTIQVAAIRLDEDAFQFEVFSRTVLHEIGHAIGLNHSSSSLDIMAATQNPAVNALSQDDVAGAQLLYGPEPAPGARAVPDYVQQVARLYEAALDRRFDAAGLNNWIDAYEGGLSFQAMAAAFLDSAEFTARFGDDDAMTNAAFVRQMYLNVLDREPDAGGSANWVGAMNAGMTREGALIGFAESAENRAHTTYLGALSQSRPGYWV